MFRRATSILLAAVALSGCRDAFDTPVQGKAAVSATQLLATRLVELEFNEALRVRVDPVGRLRSDVGADLTAIQAFIDALGVVEIQPLFNTPQDQLELLYADVRRVSGQEPSDLLSWHRILLPAGVSMATVINQLLARPEIAYAYPAPILNPPPPVTPDFTSNQNNYFGPAPSGTENVYARTQPGGTGAGVKVIDLEYDWNFDHEDLTLPPSTLLFGERYTGYGNTHGTAVLGVLVARNNGIGITGGVPSATIGVGGVHYNGGIRNVATSVTNASAQMSIGDVLLIEQQEDLDGNPNTDDFVPVEWVQSVFNAIQTATNAGRVVVLTAGNGGPNGGFNLDDPMFQGKFDRNQRYSGAIFVGAGDGTNARMSFSNYGSRLDLQGHGTSVTTTGPCCGILYGSFPNEQYTGGFNGTSSAGPIVASAVAVVQGYRKNQGRSVLTAPGMAGFLRATGSAQTGDLSKPIGPKPNLQAAISALNAAGSLSVSVTGPHDVGHSAYCQWTANVSGGLPPYTYNWTASWTTGSTGYFFVSGQGTASPTGWGYYYLSYPNPTVVKVSVSGNDAAGVGYASPQKSVNLYNSYSSGCMY